MNDKFMVFKLDDDYAIIAALHSGKVLDVSQSRGLSKDFLIQYDCGGPDNQIFKIEGDFKKGDLCRIQVKRSRRYLEYVNGRFCAIYKRYNDNQLFRFLEKDSISLRAIENIDTDKLLDEDEVAAYKNILPPPKYAASTISYRILWLRALPLCQVLRLMMIYGINLQS